VRPLQQLLLAAVIMLDVVQWCLSFSLCCIRLSAVLTTLMMMSFIRSLLLFMSDLHAQILLPLQ
jgi:hypothetical protein